MAEKHGCESCGWRAKHDRTPKSLLGRLWRWHARWCPGWKGYVQSLPPEQQTTLAARYGFTPPSPPA